jgi:hypothetical protein
VGSCELAATSGARPLQGCGKPLYRFTGIPGMPGRPCTKGGRRRRPSPPGIPCKDCIASVEGHGSRTSHLMRPVAWSKPNTLYFFWYYARLSYVSYFFFILFAFGLSFSFYSLSLHKTSLSLFYHKLHFSFFLSSINFNFSLSLPFLTSPSLFRIYPCLSLFLA